MTQEEFKNFYKILLESRVDRFDVSDSRTDVLLNMYGNIIYNMVELLKERGIFSEEDLSRVLKINSFVDSSVPLYKDVGREVLQTNMKYLMHQLGGKDLKDTLLANLIIEGNDKHGIL